MKITKIISALFLVAFLANCSGYRTQGQFITEHDDAWMNGYVVNEDGQIDQDDDATQGLVFCRANKKEDGSARPTCYQTEFR